MPANSFYPRLRPTHRSPALLACCALIAALVPLAPASAQTTLRIVSWNINADNTTPAGTKNGITYGGSNNGVPAQGAALETVLEAIGAYNPVNSGKAIDILSLQELYQTPSVTLSSITNALNAHYGAGTYAYDTTVDPVNGSGTGGNGPSGLIYNTKTIQEVAPAVSIGTPGDSGEDRAPMRYEFQVVGYGANSTFYLYNEHAKSGDTNDGSPTNGARRNTEVQGVRSNADALGSNAHVIYTGDFNLFDGTSEAAWSTLTATGNGRAIDPGSWSSVANEDEFAQGPEYRDSLQMFNPATQSQNGIQYVANSFNVFGNNGSSGSDVPVSSASNTALSGLPNQSTVLNDLTLVTDHLPVVADYTTAGITPTPEPAIVALLPLLSLLLTRPRRRSPG